MLVSIVIPACDAQGVLARAVGSLRAQAWDDWEAIIVADDLGDYAGVLAAQGIIEPRLRFATTGRRRSGCHRARNVGLALARGALVGALDADDLLRPHHLATLAPLALHHGAAADNLAVVREQDARLLYPVLGDAAAPRRLDLAALLALTAPLVPLVRRELAMPRLDGVEYAEDVIANLRLIGRLGSLLVVQDSLYEYRVAAGSIAHSPDAAAAFDRAYGDYVGRLAQGDGFGLPAELRAAAAAGLAGKRALNAAFAAALQAEPGLDFQAFVARRQAGPR
ncbi:MAG: glycosyltransferase [Rhodospirillales bacterium]|nr:glycosyltransferase [Rhodospirillales bacterium]